MWTPPQTRHMGWWMVYCLRARLALGLGFRARMILRVLSVGEKVQSESEMVNPDPTPNPDLILAPALT